jgi:hypothetical protein
LASSCLHVHVQGSEAGRPQRRGEVRRARALQHAAVHLRDGVEPCRTLANVSRFARHSRRQAGLRPTLGAAKGTHARAQPHMQYTRAPAALGRRGVLLAAGGLPTVAVVGGVLVAAGAVAAAASAAGSGGGGWARNPQLLIRQGMVKFRENDIEVWAAL